MAGTFGMGRDIPARTFVDFGRWLGRMELRTLPVLDDAVLLRDIRQQISSLHEAQMLAGLGMSQAEQQQQQALTTGIIQQAAAQVGPYDPARAALQQQAEQMAITRTQMRDLLLPGLEHVGAQRFAVGWLNPRGTWDIADAAVWTRIDVETAARSKERARGLLQSLLTPEQWTEFEQAGRVTERIGEMEFKLSPGGMIEARKPRLVEHWCVYPQPDEWIPNEDKLIGQLLHLRAGPEALREKANVFR